MIYLFKVYLVAKAQKHSLTFGKYYNVFKAFRASTFKNTLLSLALSAGTLIQFLSTTTFSSSLLLSGTPRKEISKFTIYILDTLSKTFFSISHFNSGIDHFTLLQ